MTGKCPWKKRPWKKPGVFGLLVQVENDWKMSMDNVSMEKTWSIWTPCPGGKCPWQNSVWTLVHGIAWTSVHGSP